MKSLIIGNGQIGSAIHEVLGGDVQDKEVVYCGKYDILHICFPYSREFIDEVRKYKNINDPEYIVIHSTVPIGTSSIVGAFHSPMRGVHPNLAKSLRIFVKYLAPHSNVLKTYFEIHGIKIKEVDKPETTEFTKIYGTTQYGVNILLEKWAYKFCKENGLDYDIAYIDANETYKEGYEKLGMGNVARPILKHIDGKIGGHCVVQNCDLLDSPFTELIKKMNDSF